MIENNFNRGDDCKEKFRSAYENRYTWPPEFTGYKGICSLENENRIIKGFFELGKNLKVNVYEIDDEIVKDSISKQLWEVGIHRVRRSFEDTHGLNNFTVGSNNEAGMEVIVSGKNIGDRYRIRDNVVTMVYRHIHETLITIYTHSVINTGQGYLSESYTSQYSDPITGIPKSAKSHFTDTFVPLYKNGPWVLSRRTIKTEKHLETSESKRTYSFLDLKKVI